MANANLVVLLGRLTRDPEARSFDSGGKVVKFGFAANSRRKGKDGEWFDAPVFVDVEVFNRGAYNLADLCEKYLSKGKLAFLQGELVFDQWTDQQGNKKSKLKVVAEKVQFLDPKGSDSVSTGFADEASGKTGADEIPF